MTVGARDCIGSTAGRIDGDAVARGSGAPGVAVGAGSGERSVSTAADTVVATDGDCGSGMDGKVQSVHLVAMEIVHESIGISAAGIVRGAVPSIGAPALVLCGDRARCRAAACYRNTSVDTGLATVTPYSPYGVVIVAVDADIVCITGRSGVVDKNASVSVDFVVVESGVVVFDRCFDSKASAVVGCPIIGAIAIDGTFVRSGRRTESWRRTILRVFQINAKP